MPVDPNNRKRASASMMNDVRAERRMWLPILFLYTLDEVHGAPALLTTIGDHGKLVELA